MSPPPLPDLRAPAAGLPAKKGRSTNVATFLALLELVRGGRVTLGPKGELTMQRGRLPRERAKEEE